MPIFTFANNVSTTLASPLASGSTSLTLASATNLPTSIPAGEVIAITLNDAATRQNFEVIYAGAITGATLSELQRGQEGTGDLSWLTGDYAYSPPTAGQQESFGQLAAANTWTNVNTFDEPPVIPNASTSAQALPFGQAESLFALIAGLSTQAFSVKGATTSAEAVNLGQFTSTGGSTGFFTVPTIINGEAVGLIVQRGAVALTSSGIGESTELFTLPVTYPNAHLWALAGFGGDAPPSNGAFAASEENTSQIRLTLYTQSSGTFAANYLSIGY